MKCKVNYCKASCCYNVPLDTGFISMHEDKVVNHVIRTVSMFGKIVPFTSDDMDKNKCPFLRKDYKCNVYEARPDICRKFGNGEHRFLTCKFLKQ